MDRRRCRSRVRSHRGVSESWSQPVCPQRALCERGLERACRRDPERWRVHHASSGRRARRGRLRGGVRVRRGELAISEAQREQVLDEDRTVGRDGVLRIGDDFRMNDGASIQVWHEVTIGSNVMMAPFSAIIDDHCHLVEPDSVTYERPIGARSKFVIPKSSGDRS